MISCPSLIISLTLCLHLFLLFFPRSLHSLIPPVLRIIPPLHLFHAVLFLLVLASISSSAPSFASALILCFLHSFLVSASPSPFPSLLISDMDMALHRFLKCSSSFFHSQPPLLPSLRLVFTFLIFTFYSCVSRLTVCLPMPFRAHLFQTLYLPSTYHALSPFYPLLNIPSSLQLAFTFL